MKRQKIGKFVHETRGRRAVFWELRAPPVAACVRAKLREANPPSVLISNGHDPLHANTIASSGISTRP